ncbi:MAG: hypothetical protein H8D78_10085 [Chloroflexi bacterium]|nr:hypothetical protein [Chloroflexota bacterium]
MKLSPSDVDIFYEIQTSLFSFVNQQRQLFPEPEGPDEIMMSEGLDGIDALRQALYADLSLLDRFVATNPHNLPTGYLEIARSWHHLKAGKFFIFRYLKKHTIFLDDSEPAKAYGVLGLRSDFDEILLMRPPILVEAVLLPFRNQIVFDGILKPYNIIFGGGIRRNLNDVYRQAKERFGIITSLLPKPGEEEVVAVVQDSYGRVLKAFERWLPRYGLRPQTIERHVTNVRRFAEAYLERQQPPRAFHDATLADVRGYLSSALPPDTKVKDSVVSFKKFFRFMGETVRMPYDVAYDILDYLRAW